MIRLKILGTRGLVEEKSEAHTLYTGLLVADEERAEGILVDCGERQFLKAVTKLKGVFLTHAHPDHIGGIGEKKEGVTVFASPYSNCKSMPTFVKFVEKPILVDIGKHKIRLSSFRVKHSTVAPAVSWLIEILSKSAKSPYSILFAPDFISFVDEIPAVSEASKLFIDGSSFLRPILRGDDEQYGHSATISIIRDFVKRFSVPSFGFEVIHRGGASITQPKTEEKRLLLSAGENLEHSINFPKDGDEWEIEETGALEAGKTCWSARLLSETEPPKFHLNDFLKLLKELPEEITLYKDYFTLVGSLPVSGQGHDIDILVKGEEVRAAAFRFLHLFPFEVASLIHLFPDSGPFTSNIPIADLVLRFKKPELVKMNLEMASRAAAEREAMISRKEDKVVPFRFFAMQKTKSGYHKREVFTVDEAKEMLSDAAFPWLAEIKADGMHCQVHKVGNKIKFISEDGGEIQQEQIPELRDSLLKMKQDFVVCAEIEGWLPAAAAKRRGLAQETRKRGDFYHLGRAVTAGYIHSKKYEKEISENLVLNIYDLLWKDGLDIHKKELSERVKERDSLFPKTTQPGLTIGHIQGWLLSSPKELPELWKKIKTEGYHEGLMLKPWRGNESRYVLWAEGGFWIKLKTLYEMTCRIIDIEQGRSHKTGEKLQVWRYLCAIQGTRGLVPTGWTYASKTKFKVGDNIEVQFQNLNKYTDPKTGKVFYNWWRPTVVSKEPETKEIDTVEIAEKLVAASHGEIKEKRIPKDMTVFQPLASEDVLLATVAKQPPIPKDFEAAIHKCTAITKEQLASMLDKGKFDLPPNFGIMQLHARGKSIHIDFRFLAETIGDGWSGFTFLNQVEGIPSEPILSFAEAHAYVNSLLEKGKSVSKVYPNMPPSEGFMIVPKFEGESDQLEWLAFVDKKVEFPHAGATKEYPGIFAAIDWGYVKMTVDKPWFKEVWLYFKHFKGRLVIRELQTKPGFRKAGKFKTFWRGLFSDEKSPPYIFSPGFLDSREWVPSEAALPPHWEALIPEELQWWKGKKSPSTRINLIRQAYNYLIETGYIGGRKVALGASRFVIQKVSWRGPAHIRGEAQTQYVLRFKVHDELLSFWSKQNFLFSYRQGASTLLVPADAPPPSKSSVLDWLDFEGEIPPDHPENPNKKLNMTCSILSKGEILDIRQTADDFVFRLESPEIKGYFSLVNEDGTDFYLWRKK